jgi:histidinol-phosphate/aromatic aminotransferase/cobyric acid decarboxylase-like protein
MLQHESKAQFDNFEFVSAQHGGYYRHGFIDHAYLYNLYFPPEAIFEHLKEQIHDLVLNYPVAQTVLAELVGRIIDQPADRVVVGNGASELIKIVSGNVSRKLVVPVPSFNEYVNAATPDKVVEFPLDFPSFQLDVDKFAAQAIKVKADVAVVVTPNNPTSMLIPREDLIQFLTELEAHDCMLVIDESFLDFAVNADQISMVRELDNYPNLAILKSMSKAYGICGLRIGYLVTANATFAESIRQGVHIWNINGFAEEFLRLLPDYRPEFIESCEQVRSDRGWLYDDLCHIDGLTAFRPEANFVFCRLPDEVQSGPEIAKELFVEHNIYVKHCAGKTQSDSDRYLRIASRTELENCRFVDALLDVMVFQRRREETYKDAGDNRKP